MWAGWAVSARLLSEEAGGAAVVVVAAVLSRGGACWVRMQSVEARWVLGWKQTRS